MSEREEWWVSNAKFTILVIVESGMVVGGAPVIRRFFGQTFKALIAWMRPFGGFRIERLNAQK